MQEVTGEMGDLVGQGTQTALNTSGSESVAKGCLLTALLASGSPKQSYVKAQRVMLAGTTCHRTPSPPMGSAVCGEMPAEGAGGSRVKGTSAGSGWAAGGTMHSCFSWHRGIWPLPLVRNQKTAFVQAADGAESSGGRSHLPQHSCDRRFCHQLSLTGAQGLGRCPPLGSIIPVEG